LRGSRQVTDCVAFQRGRASKPSPGKMVLPGRGGAGRGHGVQRVFFKNVSYETTASYLMKKFKNCGQVESFELWMTPDGRSKGMGTVVFSSAEDAEVAVEAMQDVDIDGRLLLVELEDPDRGYSERHDGKGDEPKGHGKGKGKGGEHKGKGKGEEHRGKGKGKGGGGSGSCKAFFKNVNFDTTAGFLQSIFKRHGHVLELHLWTTPDGRSKGMGTAEYASQAEARDAVQSLDGFTVDGRPMHVEMEDPTRSNPSGKGDDAKGAGKGGFDKGGGKGARDHGGGPHQLFFKNVLFETTHGYLTGLFRKHGFVVNVDLHKRPDGRSFGEGTVEYGSAAEAAAALAALDGFEVDGRPMSLMPFDSPERERGSSSLEKGKGSKGDGKAGKEAYGGGKDSGKGASGTCRVFFKNLLFETPQSFMLDLFKEHGFVKEFFLRRDLQGNSKGSGVCEYDHPAAARRAVEKLNGAEVDGRAMSVELEDPSRGKGGGGGGGGSGPEPRSAAYVPPVAKGPLASSRVFFKNILYETPEDFVINLFKQHGYVVDYTFFTTNEGRSKGMGRVDFRTPAEARAAVQHLNGAEVDGRLIIVEADDHREAAKGGGGGKGPVPSAAPGYGGGGSGGGKGGGGKGGKGGGTCKVFFKNVLFETTPGFLMGKFRKFGYVVNLDLRLGPEGRSKGSGTVEYGSAADARRAIEGLDGVEIDGRAMIVEYEDASRGGLATYAPSQARAKGDKGWGRSGPY